MHIVVVGAGQAGASLVAKLRNGGFDGDITLIGDEAAPPYQRPPLSKAYLLGEMDVERLFLRPLSFYEDQNITLRLGERASRINREARTITVGDEDITYDHLVLATGATPRKLPDAVGGNLGGVYSVRTIEDVDTMASEFVEGRKLLIIGGGFIGLEAAAVAAKRGLDVTVVELADRILKRVTSPETSTFFRKTHQEHGVTVREGVGLNKLIGEDRVTGAMLTDGTELELDFAIVGVGVLAGNDMVEAAGLEVENGIRVNAFGQTADPHIWAAGDCTSFPYKDKYIRLECVQNAIDQAENVAENILGAEKPYQPYPWFWSDQYDVKLQIAGLCNGYDRVVTRHGDRGNASHWYYEGDTLLAVDALSDPRDYMIGKRLIEMGKSPDPSVIADPETNMKALLKG